MSKVTRKQLLKQDDAFVAAAAQGASWVLSHRAQVTLSAIGVVALILATWGGIEFSRQRTQRAARELEAAIALLSAEVVAEDKAAPTATPPTFASEEAKWRAAEQSFARVVDRAGLRGAGVLAGFYCAQLRTKLGDKGPAKEMLMGLLNALSPTDSLYFLAVERVALLQEGDGDLKAAVATWKRLSDGTDPFYADHATFEQARLLLKLGDIAAARGLLEPFGTKFAASPLREKAEEALAQLGPVAVPTDVAAPAPRASAP